MTQPSPMVPNEPQAWMTVDDVFHISGRGTVVTGRLEGNYPLSVGDTLICDGQRWSVKGIEKFRELLKTAQPGENIGVLLGGGRSGSGYVLRGRRVIFMPGSAHIGGGGGISRLWRRRG